MGVDRSMVLKLNPALPGLRSHPQLPCLYTAIHHSDRGVGMLHWVSDAASQAQREQAC